MVVTISLTDDSGNPYPDTLPPNNYNNAGLTPPPVRRDSLAANVQAVVRAREVKGMGGGPHYIRNPSRLISRKKTGGSVWISVNEKGCTSSLKSIDRLNLLIFFTS
jgi:hypothetical protein